jgi:hypothetical protein
MSPARAILVDALASTRKHLIALGLAESESRCSRVMNLASRGTFSMSCKVSQNRLDELVVGWNWHALIRFLGHLILSWRHAQP